jgi:hypothetical protein
LLEKTFDDGRFQAVEPNNDNLFFHLPIVEARAFELKSR